MDSNRIKEIQEATAYPNSQSVRLALLQVWNECGQSMYTEEEVYNILLKHTESLFEGERITLDEFFQRHKK